MSLVGEAILGAFIQLLFDKLATPAINELLGLQLNVDEELEQLLRTLRRIRAVLRDAEERQTREEAVRLWLDDLKDVAYDMSDMLDDVATEARRRQMKPFQPVFEIFSPLSLNRLKFRNNILTNIEGIRKRLDDIAKDRRDLQLRELDGGPSCEGSGTSSLIDKSKVFGRDTDARAITRLLTSDEYCGKNISVIPILGAGGIGKTTLAQLVYNDDNVDKHFEVKIWVYVTRDFSARRLIKAIIECVDGRKCSLLDLDPMQHRLQNLLDGRRFLLVLDDMWIESHEEWEKLRVALSVGARGSRVLITTASEVVAKLVGTIPPYELHVLSNEECWSLFSQYAFSDRDPQSYDNLVSVGKEIVKKCRGLPVAARTFGILLRSETDRNKWESVLSNEIWELPGGNGDILRTIRLSYQHLPSHLKRCFAYCSVFPKNFVFDKEVLVQLWIAQDLIQPNEMECLEEIGGQYFDHLLHRSFFRFSHFDYATDQPRYVMHDHIHSLAKSVAGEECHTLEVGKRCNIPRKARHASLLCDSSTTSMRKTFEAIYIAKGLYTLLLIIRDAAPSPYGMEIPDDLAQNLARLRSLDLSNTNLHQLPDSIGDLEHLRYLSISNTNIRGLPESVCNLYFLQTLRLKNCYRLLKLPSRMKDLLNLRHLDLRLDEDLKFMACGDCSRKDDLKYMAPDIGKLTSLQTLSRFVASTKSRCGIEELKGLADLHGQLCISNLQSVSDASQAMAANLKGKRYINNLELRWLNDPSSEWQDQIIEVQILANLQPHTNLNELRIEGYRAPYFPTWVGDSSFSNLVMIKLFHCKNCTQLPALGQLPSLKELHIKGMHGVTRVDCAFCGHRATRGFPSLNKLRFESMMNWEKWRGNEVCRLPSLRELVIKDCPKLSQITHILPALTMLEIERCEGLLGLPRIPSLHSLEVKFSGEWIWGSLCCLSSIKSLTLTGLPTRILPQGLQGYTFMRRLELCHCMELISLPDGWLPNQLTHLIIKHCPELRALPRGILKLNSLEYLEIHECGKLASIPEELKQLETLKRIKLSGCQLSS